MPPAYYAVVPAAGAGARFGGAQPKQYERIDGRPMLEHTVRALGVCPAIACVFVVLAPGDERYAECSWSGVAAAVEPLYCGGPTRASTVFNALMAVRDTVDDADWMLVHDAARPCVSQAELQRLVDSLSADAVGGLLALPVADTLKRGDAQGRVIATESRDALWRALTPQMFRYRLLVEALHRSRTESVTDEASAVEALGLHPRLVLGAAINIKVTYAEDLALASAILEARKQA